jgi:hypothetical protein
MTGPQAAFASGLLQHARMGLWPFSPRAELKEKVLDLFPLFQK